MKFKVFLSIILFGISLEQNHFESSSFDYENETSEINETNKNQTFKVKIFKVNTSVYDIIFDK